MRPLIIDSFAGGGACEGIRAVLDWQPYGMNSRPCVCPSDQTVRHALANLRLGMLRIRLDGSRAFACSLTTAPRSVCCQTKHWLQCDESGKIKLPSLHSLHRFVFLRTSGIASSVSKLKLLVGSTSQTSVHSCSCTDRSATLDKVNGAIA